MIPLPVTWQPELRLGHAVAGQGAAGCQVVCRTGLYTFGILLYDKVFLFKHICEPECLNKNAFYNYGIFSGYNRCIMMACVGTLRHRVVKFPAFGEMSMGS